MVQILFEYHQSKDMRWYASEPTVLPGAEAAGVARAAGETVTTESNKFISWLKTSTSEGVCYALSGYWLALNSRGEDFWTWLGPGQRAAPTSERVHPAAGEVVVKIRNMMRAQQQGIEKSGSLGRLLEMQEFLKANSPLRKCSKRLSNDMPIDGAGTFFFIGIDGQGRKTGKTFSHAVAARLNNDGAILFDPNFGDIQTTGLEELNEYITDACKTAYDIDLSDFVYMALA